MNRLMKYVLLLSGIFFLVGCVKENLDGCRKNFTLKLKLSEIRSVTSGCMFSAPTTATSLLF